MSKRKSSTIFFQTKISSLKIEIGCQTWAKSNLRLLECCSWGKLNWNVISGRWTPFKITNIPAAWMVDSYEYSGIKNPPLLTCEPLHTTIGRMPFKEVGTYGFQFKWNDKLDTALYALLVSRNMYQPYFLLACTARHSKGNSILTICVAKYFRWGYYVELQIWLAL